MKNLICGIAVGSVLGAVLASHPTVKKMAKQAKSKIENMTCICDCNCEERHESHDGEEM